MQKRRVFLLSLILLGLVGCRPDNGSEMTDIELNQTVELSKTPIQIWLDDAYYGRALEVAVEAMYPDIDLIWEVVESTGARNNLELEGPIGIGPDIFIQPHDNMMPSIQGDLLLPLSKEIGADIEERFIESTVETVKFDGEYYGFPLSTETVALFYNQSLLNEYGFEVAKSFEEIKRQGDIFNQADENKFIIRYEAGNAYTMHFFLTAFGYELFGPNHDDVAAINFESDAVIEGLNYYHSMKKYLPLHFSELTVDTIEKEFAKGTIPYVIVGPWAIAEIKSKGIFKWGVTTIPTINGVQPLTFSGNIIACVSAYTKYPEEAQKVLEFMSTDEGLEILYRVRGTIPALKDPLVIEGLADDEYVKGILEQAAFSEAMPSIPELGSYWFPAERLFRSVWVGMQTPEEAVIQATEDFREVLLLLN